MKTRYDNHVIDRKFKPGDKVLALLPIPGRPLQARYFGPYTIDKKTSDLNYIINTPGRRKNKQMYHVKQYFDRDSSISKPITVVNTVPQESNVNSDFIDKSYPGPSKLVNSDILRNLKNKLSHLEPSQQEELKQLIHEYEHLFPDIPTRTDKIYHDVIVEDSKPIKQHPYRMNPLKQKYLQDEVKYLLENDFIEPSQSNYSSVGQGQVKPLEAKINAISEFPVPKCKRQLMRFLGMAGYYRKFCKNFSGIAEPLTNLLKKSTKFKWNDKCQDAFDRLKAILKSAPVLLAPDFDKCFKLAVDASDVGIGAVLLREDNNGIDHPVCYFSKKFNKHQKNYSTIEKECLALILAIQQFEVYLTSSTSPIVVFSDHNPLSFLHKLKNKNQRLLRWSLLLQEFNLDIRHIKGKDNIIPYALSRV